MRLPFRHTGNPSPSHCAKALDSRNHRVRELWQRRGRFSPNLTVTDDLGPKCPRVVPLSGTTLDEVKDDGQRLPVERDDDRLRPLGLSPKLADSVGGYQQQPEVSGKRASAVEKEKDCLRHRTRRLGHLRLNKIRPHPLSKVLTEPATDGY